MGQLERLTIKREHGLELFAGGEGHGEPPGIDWAHDYVTSGRIQKMRITLWESCPDYEVVRGPLCTMIRRWGFPYSPVHPIFSPARMHVDVEYRFYAGLPWFHKLGTMTATRMSRSMPCVTTSGYSPDSRSRMSYGWVRMENSVSAM